MIAASALILCVSLLTQVGEAAPVVGSEQTTEEIARTLRQVQIEYAFSLTEADLRRATRAKIDEGVLQRWLKIVYRKCLEGSRRCETTTRLGSADETVGELVFAVLGKLGSTKSLPLLLQLEARGIFEASQARAVIQMRELEADARACPPPTDEEVRAAWQELGGFPVLAFDRGQLQARPPTEKERDDLAYFFAATRPERTAAQVEDDPGDWHHPGPPNAEREGLLVKRTEAAIRGDLKAEAELARAYLSSLGYPGPLRRKEEHEYAWGGPASLFVMRRLAAVDEQVGNFDEAAQLYRRAQSASAACGTGAGEDRIEQLKGLIRSSERAGRCREVITERMELQLALGDAAAYGTDRLRHNGFDVERLFRGALVTVNHSLPSAQIEQAIARADASSRGVMLGWLHSHRDQDWETQTRALEGWSALVSERALPSLIQLARTGTEAVRVRALRTLGQLGNFDERAACDPTGCVAPSHGGEFSTDDPWDPVPALGSRCQTALSEDRRAALVTSVARSLDDPSWEVRAAAADALGKIGGAEALPPLQQHSADPAISGAECEPGSTRNCRPLYPVQRRVKRAIEKVEAHAAFEQQTVACRARARTH